MIISIFKRKEKLFTCSILHFSFLFFIIFIVIIFSFFLVKLLYQKHIFRKIMKKSRTLRGLQSSLNNRRHLLLFDVLIADVAATSVPHQFVRVKNNYRHATCHYVRHSWFQRSCLLLLYIIQISLYFYSSIITFQFQLICN